MYLPFDLFVFFRTLESEIPAEFNEFFVESSYRDMPYFVNTFGQYLQRNYLHTGNNVYRLFQAAGIEEPEDMADMAVRLYYTYLREETETRRWEANRAARKKAAEEQRRTAGAQKRKGRSSSAEKQKENPPAAGKKKPDDPPAEE